MENKVTVLHYQSLLDICLQTTGSIEGIFAFALLNGISITATPEAGSILQTIDKTDRRIHAYYAAHNVRPATGINMALPTQLEGIGYWFIENDFIVQ